MDQPGPDVSDDLGRTVDVVSYVPPDAVGRSNIYLSSVGQATLVVEIRDSESNACWCGSSTERAAQNYGVTQLSTSVTNWSEVQQLARTWATQLRDGLDEAATWDQ